jgi:hypothetical protein
LPTPSEKKVPPPGSATTAAPAAETTAEATADKPRSLWPLSLYDIEAFFARMVGQAESTTEPVSKPPAEKPAVAQPQ